MDGLSSLRKIHKQINVHIHIHTQINIQWKKKQLEGNDEGPFAKLKLLCHVETNSVDQKYMMSRGKNDTSSPTLT